MKKISKAENFSKWYHAAITAGDLIEFTPVSGCYVLKPRTYTIWEIFQNWFNEQISALGVKNCYFPLFIPESLLKREASHIAGFEPEVAWVTIGGHSQLQERLAIRPTSETIMYAAFAKWIRSWRDLPLKINQWCSVVRWEFKHPIPFLRTREFLWQEGHTAHASHEDADAEARQVLDIYERAYRELFAVPTIKGKKSEKEKFAGADYTYSLETFLPNGKAIQCCTSHCLGQNFSKAFGISYLDRSGKRQLVWQNSWGFTTRSIGIAMAFHGDDRGLCFPPAIAPEQIVIVPIYYGKEKQAVLEKAKQAAAQLKGFRLVLDDRQDHTPGWKFNHWEVLGVPLRIELGPKDLAAGQVQLVRRDNFEKSSVGIAELRAKVKALLKDIQKSLYKRALEQLRAAIVKVKNLEGFERAIKEKRFAFAPWCCKRDCEEVIEDKFRVKCISIPFDQPKPEGVCFHCGRPAASWAYWAKAL